MLLSMPVEVEGSRGRGVSVGEQQFLRGARADGRCLGPGGSSEL